MEMFQHKNIAFENKSVGSVESIRSIKLPNLINNQETILNLDKFNILESTNQSELKSNNFLIIGKRGSGKTNIIKDFMCELSKNKVIENIIIFSTNTNSNYETLINPEHTYKIQNKLNSKTIKKILTNQSDQNAKPLLIILDEIIHSKKILYNENFKELIISSHNLNIYLIMSIQFPINLCPQIKNNIDCFIIYADDMILNKKTILKNYLNKFTKYEIFDEIMKQICTNYSALVFDKLHNMKWHKSQLAQDQIIDLIDPNEL